jgi:hypothetical protein
MCRARCRPTNGVSAFATAFADVGSRRDFGAMIGLSYTFGGGIAASTQSNLQDRAFAQSTEIVTSAGQENARARTRATIGPVACVKTTK